MRRVSIVVLAVVALAWSVAPAFAASWAVQESPTPGTGTNVVSGVAVISSSDVWAAGYFNDYGDDHGKVLLMHDGGTGWELFEGKNPGLQSSELHAVAAVASDDVWAVGEYDDVGAVCPQPTLIEHWNGRRWKVISSHGLLPCNNLESVAALSSDDVWAVGGTFDQQGSGSALALHWDGTFWTVRNDGIPEFTRFDSVSADAPDDVWAVGDVIARWDGTSWEVMGSVPDANHHAIAAIAPDDVWVVGTTYRGHHTLTYTEHWDGTSWSVVPSPNRGRSRQNYLTSVTALGPDDVWAVGRWVGSAGVRALVLHWNGQEWKVQYPEDPSPLVNSLEAVSGLAGTGQLWAVGEAGVRTGQTTTLVERRGVD